MKESVEIELLYGHKEFTPGDSLSGRIRWTAGEAAVEEVVLRLFWFTSGRGSKDSEIIDERNWTPPSGAGGEDAFTFQLPWMPFSFSGTLISLTWALEAVVKPGGAVAMIEFVLSPSGKEVLLEAVEEPSKARQFLRSGMGRRTS